MIKFFRKLRWSSLSRKRIPKYLLYAIGEIILVVIGILIALQVNNWNTERLHKIEEQSYLKALSRDLSKDANNLKQSVSGLDSMIIVLEKIREGLVTDSIKIEQDIAFTGSLTATFSFLPEKATIEDLKSTGKLNLITNKKVTDSLLSYYNYLDNEAQTVNTAIITYARDNIAPVLMKEYSLEFDSPKSLVTEDSKIKNLTVEQKANPFLLNAVKFRMYSLTFLKLSYIQLIQSISQIQEMLEAETKT